jgi:hypothetical protein
MQFSLTLYQIVITLISVFMIVQGTMKFLKKESHQTLLKLFVRLLIWGGMATVALFPSVTNLIAETIGMKGNINAVILTGFLLVFLMIFKLLSAIERLENQITDLTRKESLKDIHEEK